MVVFRKGQLKKNLNLTKHLELTVQDNKMQVKVGSAFDKYVLGRRSGLDGSSLNRWSSTACAVQIVQSIMWKGNNGSLSRYAWQPEIYVFCQIPKVERENGVYVTM